MGVRPFYYCFFDRTFLFASEIKALLSHPRVPRRLNENRVADYLAMSFEDKASTFYREIFRLPPGHCLSVGRNGARMRAYWSLDPDARLELKSAQEYAEAFRAIFTAAVECRLRHSRPLAFLLSGGLDSSSIVATARLLTGAGGGGERLTAFSASFPDFPQIDEQAYIDEVLALGGIGAQYVPADQASPLAELDEILSRQDEPFHAPNLFVYWVLARAAREAGVAVLVDGVDGDTVVSHGMEYLAELVRQGRWGAAAAETAALSRRFGHPRWRFLWHFGLKPGLVLPLAQRLRAALGRSEAGNGAVPLAMNPDFARRIQWPARHRALAASRSRLARTLKEAHWLQVTSGIVPFYLEVNDKAAAAFGIEHRHPFYDRRLVEFCYAVPSDRKLAGGWDRAVQRRAMENIVPEKIRLRVRKADFGANFKRGFLERGRGLVDEVLDKNPGNVAEFADLPALRAALARCRAGRITERDGMGLWLAVTLGVWLRRSPLG